MATDRVSFIVLLTMIGAASPDVANAAPVVELEMAATDDTRGAEPADLDAALAFLKKESPQIHDDSLRVWKNFKSGKSQPHYSYRFWARNLILWLRSERNIVFNSQAKVAHVFNMMVEKGLISSDAAVVLTIDAWGYLVHHEGIPDLRKGLPKEQQKFSKKQGQET